MTHTQGLIACFAGVYRPTGRPKIAANVRHAIAMVKQTLSQLWPAIKAKNRLAKWVGGFTV